MSNMKTESLLADLFKERDRALKIEIANGTAMILREMVKPLVERVARLEHRIAFLEAGQPPKPSG